MSGKHLVLTIGAMVVAYAGTVHAATAPETPTITENYSGSSTVPIFSIITANAYPDGSFGDTQFGATINPPAYSFSDPFLKDSKILTSKTFFFGESYGQIISDAEPAAQTAALVSPEKHLVVAIELTKSQSAIGSDFGDFFSSGPTESQIIGALDTLYDSSSDDAAKQAASSTVFQFIEEASSLGALVSTNGSTNGPYNLVSFSNGQSVGSGVATLTGVVSAAPEPSVWVLMFGGIGLVGGALRLQKAFRRGRGEDELTAVA